MLIKLKISIHVVYLCLFTLLVGCSSYQKIALKSSPLIDKKKYDKAIELYDNDLKEVDRERLLYLMDKGMILQRAGKYEESKKLFLEADRLADELDAISITTQAGAFLSNDETIPYKGEDYEKIMINAFNALNYVALNDLEGALVECRRANEKLDVLKRNQGQKYREDAFIYYLSAVLYETTGEINDAYIDYKRAYQLNPNFPYLKNDLLRLSSELGFEHEQWRAKFDKDYQIPDEKDQGELVVFYSAGKSPKKIPHRRSPASMYVGYGVAGGAGLLVGSDTLIPVPRFRKRKYKLHRLKVWHEDREIAQSHELENLEKVGIQSLKDRLGREVARSAGRLAAKVKVQDQVRRNFGGLAGLVVGATFLLTQKADTRSWLTLPASLQVARAHMRPGEYHLNLRYYNQSNSFYEDQESRNVIIKPHQKTILFTHTTR